MPKAPEIHVPAPLKKPSSWSKKKSHESDEGSSDSRSAVIANKRKQSLQATTEAIEDPPDFDAVSDKWSNRTESPVEIPHSGINGARSYGTLPNDNEMEEERESPSPPATTLPLSVRQNVETTQPGEAVDNNTDRTTSAIRLSSSDSSSSVEFILSRSQYPPSTYPTHLLPYLIPASPSQRQRPPTKDMARRLARAEARRTASHIIARAQHRLKREGMKNCETALLKKACMKGELKRAKRTATARITFQDIDTHNDGYEEDSRYKPVLVTQDNDIAAETKAFAGQIIIQDRLTAMSQALSEHTKDGTLRTEPGRHSFHVDASVSSEDEIAGIAVVHKTHRQYWASPWTAKGYRIRETLDQIDAETWAIWQALQVIIEKVHADRAERKPQDPCNLAVVYSDCQSALQNIGNSSSDGGEVVQRIIAQSMELRWLGVGVHLHWVPGHRNIPGNELADLVSKKARRPFN